MTTAEIVAARNASVGTDGGGHQISTSFLHCSFRGCFRGVQGALFKGLPGPSESPRHFAASGLKVSYWVTHFEKVV